MTRTQIDLDDEAEEPVSVLLAETADELHRWLVFSRPGRYQADPIVATALLGIHHEREPDTSVVTAMLLLTDQRWRKGVHRLVRRIADSDEINDDHLDMLARTFIAADDHVYWQVPESWWGDESVVLEIEIPEDDTADDTNDVASDRAVAARPVHPALRRWAAARLVAADPNVWSELCTRALDRGGVHGAAIMDGLLDAVDLPDSVQAPIIDLAVEWSQGGVRKHALQRLADTGRRQIARDRAVVDANARTREWAVTLLEPDAADDPPEPAQASLF